MPAALQCPDCGHQEMLDNLGGVATFRCGGCGRALKVPPQLRQSPDGRGTDQSSRPQQGPPAERTQALPKLPPTAPAVPAPVAPPAAAAPVAAGGAAPKPSVSLEPPLILRVALWVIALPLGSLIAFFLATGIGLLTKRQLEDTILLPGWGRFVPIARLLPLCALATALIVQLGVFGLERLRAHNLRSGPPGRRRKVPPVGPGPRRPMGPGEGQRTTNGARSRERVIS